MRQGSSTLGVVLRLKLTLKTFLEIFMLTLRSGDIQHDNIVFTCHADIDYTGFRHQIFRYNTFCESSSLKFPIYDFVDIIEFHFDESYSSWRGRLANNSPSSSLFIFYSIRIMNFSVCKMKSNRFYTNLVFNNFVIPRHYTYFNTIQFRF